MSLEILEQRIDEVLGNALLCADRTAMSKARPPTIDNDALDLRPNEPPKHKRAEPPPEPEQRREFSQLKCTSQRPEGWGEEWPHVVGNSYFERFRR